MAVSVLEELYSTEDQYLTPLAEVKNNTKLLIFTVFDHLPIDIADSICVTGEFISENTGQYADFAVLSKESWQKILADLLELFLTLQLHRDRQVIELRKFSAVSAMKTLIEEIYIPFVQLLREREFERLTIQQEGVHLAQQRYKELLSDQDHFMKYAEYLDVLALDLTQDDCLEELIAFVERFNSRLKIACEVRNSVLRRKRVFTTDDKRAQLIDDLVLKIGRFFVTMPYVFEMYQSTS